MSRTLLKTPMEMMQAIAEYVKSNGILVDTDKSDMDSYTGQVGAHKVTVMYNLDEIARVDVDSDSSFAVDGKDVYCDQGDATKLAMVYHEIG
ncbi:MAG: hypothetical protein HUJ71_00225 [Pseudobutyrivibrio sp.]|nr:hypothetical protein [Pseudobutyrivibrio sp.]